MFVRVIIAFFYSCGMRAYALWDSSAVGREDSVQAAVCLTVSNLETIQSKATIEVDTNYLF